MRILVTALNICSSLASLGVAWLGFRIAYFGLLGISYHDYSAIILGGALAVVFLIGPAICVTVSTRQARRDRKAAIGISLIPLLLIVVGLLALIFLPRL